MKNNMINQIHNNLDSLNMKRGEKSLNQKYKIRINDIESKYNIYIPEDYKEIILNYKDLFFDDEVIYTPIEKSPWTPAEGTQTFYGFFNLEDSESLDEQIECYLGRMPTSLIPIGECPGGNLICLGIKEPYIGKVYFWDHENELEGRLMAGENVYTEDRNSYWDNLYLVSETLLDFINSLQIYESDEEVNCDDVEIWLDDDLLND